MSDRGSPVQCENANRFRRRGARLLAFVLAILLAPAALSAADTFKIDPDYSTAIFKIAHLGISQIVARINDPSGAFTIDAANPQKSTFNVEFRVDNVDTHNAHNDKWIKSPDFLDAKRFPTITFKSTSVKKLDDTHYAVTGDLTLHGVTKSLTINVTDLGQAKQPNGDLRSGIETTFTIKRSDYGMTFMIGPNGFGDEVTIMVNLEGVKAKE